MYRCVFCNNENEKYRYNNDGMLRTDDVDIGKYYNLPKCNISVCTRGCILMCEHCRCTNYVDVWENLFNYFINDPYDLLYKCYNCKFVNVISDGIDEYIDYQIIWRRENGNNYVIQGLDPNPLNRNNNTNNARSKIVVEDKISNEFKDKKIEINLNIVK